MPNYPLPELSRRAAMCFTAPMFQDLNLQKEFIAALEKAPTFQDLPAEWQRIILQAEQQMHEREQR